MSAETISVDELISWKYRFGRIDGSVIAAKITLLGDGTIAGYNNRNERSWAVENGCLVFKNDEGTVTTIFNRCQHGQEGYILAGQFLPRGPGLWHTLVCVGRAIPAPEVGIVAQLIRQLYSGDGPFGYADTDYADEGYPHTNLRADLVDSVLEVVRPRFWLELGSMLGGSAIRAADVIKQRQMSTEIVCIDPFTGDVNMWAWERGLKVAGAWRFLRLERGRPTICDRFLANIVLAGHGDIILPIMATSTVGIKLLRRLRDENRISTLPEVIYLDSAHEPAETLLELENCWKLLSPGGVLMGDDWDWEAVRNDVIRFARTVEGRLDHARPLIERHGKFKMFEQILLDQGQWALVKSKIQFVLPSRLLR